MHHRDVEATPMRTDRHEQETIGHHHYSHRLTPLRDRHSRASAAAPSRAVAFLKGGWQRHPRDSQAMTGHRGVLRGPGRGTTEGTRTLIKSFTPAVHVSLKAVNVFLSYLLA